MANHSLHVQYLGGGLVEQRPLADFHPHPEFGVVPRPSAEQRTLILNSMQTRWFQDTPIEVTPELVILDGHTRFDIAREIGWDLLAYIIVNIPANLQVDYMVRKAAERRQFTPEQLEAQIKLLRDKAWSNRRIAEATGKSEATIRRRGSGASHDAPARKVTGKDGKSYPAAQPTPKPRPTKRNPVTGDVQYVDGPAMQPKQSPEPLSLVKAWLRIDRLTFENLNAQELSPLDWEEIDAIGQEIARLYADRRGTKPKATR